MNAKINPTGTKGTITFTGGITKAAVRTADGVVYVQSVNPNLWLPCDAAATALFVEA